MQEDASLAQEEVRPDDIEQVEAESVEETKTEEPKKPDSVPLHVLDKQREQKRQAEAEADRLRKELEAAKQEKDLLLLGMPKQKEEAEIDPPHPDDYVDHDEYVKASREFNKQFKEKITKENEQYVADLLEKRQRETLEQQQREELDKRNAEARQRYLERADALNDSEFLEAEKALYDRETGNGVWTQWFFNHVVEGFDNSEQVIAVLGRDPDRALKMAQEFDRNPIKAFKDFHNLADELASKSKTGGKPLPEPDTPIEGGVGAMSDYESRLEKQRQLHREGKKTMNDLLEWKRNNKPPA